MNILNNSIHFIFSFFSIPIVPLINIYLILKETKTKKIDYLYIIIFQVNSKKPIIIIINHD